jgi:hypothetical protein
MSARPLARSASAERETAARPRRGDRVARARTLRCLSRHEEGFDGDAAGCTRRASTAPAAASTRASTARLDALYAMHEEGLDGDAAGVPANLPYVSRWTAVCLGALGYRALPRIALVGIARKLRRPDDGCANLGRPVGDHGEETSDERLINVLKLVGLKNRFHLGAAEVPESLDFPEQRGK